MQPNPIIIEETAAQMPDAEFGEEAAALASAQSQLLDANALPFHREFAAQDYDLSILPDTAVERVLRKRSLYSTRPAGRRLLYRATKRGVDVTVAATLLLLTLPVFVVVALVIKATSRGPVFFRHKRLGRGGREFGCLKFRTMVVDAEELLKRDDLLRHKFEQDYKIKDDPRITRVGRILRKTSLDELPQLLHVLGGGMSLIGPRPIVRPELGKYSIYGNKLLTVKPGLSGLWQVCGRSDTTYPQRVMMDMHYIDHRSLTLDMRLMLLTVVAVARKSGAC
ncbi:MAG TPA: sugar transferase [Pyrinomonadaceae bacterium]|nr:sugar transferase [Pyrinomonadaceae bacterium]